tara:strand:- start:97112 stop:100873 length:3762 start_codon:yes stop_codon:yes gene_type:complete
VWSANRIGHSKKIAIKVSLTRRDPRFAREAAAMRSLGSKVCPEVLGEGLTAAGFPFIAMEQVDGVSLGHWIANSKHRVPPLRKSMEIFAKLCEQVQTMHERELLHRDLKPENIMLLGDGSLRLLDLGLARGIDDAPHEDEVLQPSLTQTGAMLGTVAYIAPEQSLGRRNLGFAADLYSLAVIGFEMLTGRLPFWGSRSAILQAHTWHKPPAASQFAQLTKAVDDALAKGLAKDPRNRWPTAASFSEVLQHAVRKIPEREPQATTPSDRPSSRKMALLAIDGTLSLASATKAAANVGGQVARTSDSGFVVVFASADSLKQGVTAALALAHESFEHATQSVVHVAKLRSRKGSRGVMVMGDAIKNYQHWSSGFGPGLHATPEAAPFVSHSQLASKSADGRMVLRGRKTSPPTHTGIAVDWHSMSIEVQFWGRRKLIRAIEADARACIDEGIPTITTVTGEMGLGKTHLARHLLARVGGWNHLRIIQIRAAADHEHRGDALLQRLVREAFRLFEAKPNLEEVENACAEKLPPQLAQVSSLVVARALDVIDVEEFDRRSSLVGATAIRQALARAIAEALVQTAKQHPLAIVIDDAHRADFTTLDAIEMATLGSPGVPIWTLALASPALLEIRSNWGARAGANRVHELDVLDRNSALGMLKQLLFPVEFIPESTLTAIIELTHGVPLHLEEVANALKRNGAIRKRQGTESWILASDQLMQASQTPVGKRLATAALSGMREDVAKFAQLCAVAGPKLGVQDVDQVQSALHAELGFSSLEPSAAINHLVEKRILRRSGADRFEFRHPMTRDALEAQLSPALQRLLHAALLSTLPTDTTPPAQLARHAERAGETQLAATMYLKVATAAEARFRYVEAEQAYTSTLANLHKDDVQNLSEALTGRARVHSCVGRHDDALADLEAAMTVAKAKADIRGRAGMLLEKATILDWKFQYAESAAAALEAAALISELDDKGLILKSDLAAARSHFRAQDYNRSISKLTETTKTAKQLEDHTSHVISLALLGGALVAINRLDKAQSCLNQMIDLSRRVGDRLHLSVAYANRMHVWMARHDYENAVADASSAASVANEIGAFPVIWVSQHSKAQLLLWLGRHEEAAAIANEARELQHRFTNTPDPSDTILVARIKAASSDNAVVAQQELAYMRAQHAFDTLSPLHQKQSRMLELWQTHGGAHEWNELLASSIEVLETNELLEFLLLFARAAIRDHRGDDVTLATTKATSLVDPDSHWLRIFGGLQYTNTV